MDWIRRHPVAGWAVAAVAVTALVAGPADAGSKKREYVISKKSQIAPKVRKQLKGNRGKRGLQGIPGTPGARGATAPRGATGQRGTPGAPGTARAYASIGSGGTVNAESGAKGITNAMVRRVGSGEYCLGNLGFAPRSAIVSADNGFNSEYTVASVVTFTGGATPSGCAAGEAVRVRTLNLPAGGAYTPPTLQDKRFVIWIEG